MLCQIKIKRGQEVKKELVFVLVVEKLFLILEAFHVIPPIAPNVA
jgi:hypothetical protein